MAAKYYKQSIEMSESLGDYDAIGTSSVNLGEIYLADDADSSALFYFEKALEAYRKSTTGNVPYALNGIGKVYAKEKILMLPLIIFRRLMNLPISIMLK